MGCSGGIKIVNIDDLSENFISFKEKIINNVERDLQDIYYKTDWDDLMKFKQVIQSYPDTLKFYSDEDILDLFKDFKNCDSPFIIENHIIFSEGDNIEFKSCYFSESLDGIYKETWT